MDMEDLDATPRVLRVVNPESSGDSACETSQIITEKGRRFSLRSISGSLSSIWGSESTSRSHTELSQDLSSRGCSSFSSLLTANRTNSLELQQRFPIDGEVRVSKPSTDVSLLETPTNHQSSLSPRTAALLSLPFPQLIARPSSEHKTRKSVLTEQTR